MCTCTFSWLSTEVVAFSPCPHPYLPCLLPCLVRDSLCTALQTKILWITGLLMQLTLLKFWVSGNLTCPDGTFAAGYTMARGRGGESCVLAALSVEDIDIYLFGTMITGIFADWIRLNPGLSKNSENGKQLSKAPQGCPYD